MTDRVAGHLFADSPRGEACSDCNKTWLEVLNMRELWIVGAHGIACRGALNTPELESLHAKLQRIWDAGMRF